MSVHTIITPCTWGSRKSEGGGHAGSTGVWRHPGYWGRRDKREQTTVMV